MIQLATDDVMLLHMHQGLASPCNEDEEEGTEGKEGQEVKQQTQDKNFNGVYYDVRVKTHYFGT